MATAVATAAAAAIAGTASAVVIAAFAAVVFAGVSPSAVAVSGWSRRMLLYLWGFLAWSIA